MFSIQSFWSGFDPIRVDTLIAETNSGSLRWMEGLEDMPIPLRSIQEGGSNLDLFVLPDEGISVEEVAQMEASEETGKTSKLVADSSSSIQNVDYPQMLITKGDTVADEQQTYQEEFEEAQAIMSAPPGAVFVPGIDDVDEEDCEVGLGDDDEDDCEPKSKEGGEDLGEMGYDQYLETLNEEYEDAMRKYEVDALVKDTFKGDI